MAAPNSRDSRAACVPLAAHRRSHDRRVSAMTTTSPKSGLTGREETQDQGGLGPSENATPQCRRADEPDTSRLGDLAWLAPERNDRCAGPATTLLWGLSRCLMARRREA
jgi:hypothetical protein